MSFPSTSGEHSTFPGFYNVSGNTTSFPLNTPWVQQPVFTGKNAFGTVPPLNKTDTTGSQLEPYAPSIFPIIADSQERVMSIQSGDIIFNLHPKEYKTGIHMGKSLWDLNYSLCATHAQWQDAMKVYNDPVNLLHRAMAGRKRKGIDFLEQLEQKNIQSLERFNRDIYYVGVTTDPGMSHVNKADTLSKTSGVRTLVINHKGRVMMPNIWGGNLEMGTSVGLIVKKFTDPTIFMKDDLSWPEIIENLSPIEVWPIVGLDGPGGLHGGEYKSFLVDHDTNVSNNKSLISRLPGAMRGINYAERDPWKVDCSYFDYEIEKIDNEDGTQSFNGKLVQKAGMYIHIGRVYKSVPSSPSLAEIRSAVNPYGQDRGALATEWIRLLSDYQIEVFVDQPGVGYFLS